MTRAIVLFIVVAMAVLVGCGSNKKDIDALRAEQDRALQQARDRMDTLAAEMRRVREDIRELDSDLFELRGYLDLALTEARDAAEARAEAATAEAGSGPRTEMAAAEEVPLEPIEADVDTLAVELTKVRDQLAKLNAEYTADKELATLRDPRQTWEAMGDAEQLSSRLDRFAKVHADTIEDPVAREQFLTDVSGLKEQLGARANMTTEEQIAHYQESLEERFEAETNERMRGWYEQQLNTLASGDEEAVERQLQRAALLENARGVSELASKYDISRDTLRDNGLLTFGGFGGRRPGGRDRGGGGRTRGR